MTALAINISDEQLAEFCQRWQIREVSLFGSVLRDDFGPNSDVDVLVTLDEQATRSMLDVIAAEQELAAILGRPVDLLVRSAVERSENWIRRRRILNSARTIYAR
jgi:predicted nucleotidyltransferase